MSARILVTGFAPFGAFDVNSSWEGVARLAATRDDFEAERLPVDHAAAAARLQTLLAARRPEICLLTGLASGAACRLERLARRPAEAPPASGAAPDPTFRLGAWDWSGALARLEAARCPVAQSVDAGLYVCETSYRAALDWRAEHGAPAQIAFLHVPPLSEDWPVERIAAAIAATLDAVAGSA